MQPKSIWFAIYDNYKNKVTNTQQEHTNCLPRKCSWQPDWIHAIST